MTSIVLIVCAAFLLTALGPRPYVSRQQDVVVAFDVSRDRTDRLERGGRP